MTSEQATPSPDFSRDIAVALPWRQRIFGSQCFQGGACNEAQLRDTATMRFR